MRTAALLPTPGDPFHVRWWLRNYERVWMGEVDELHVLVNGQPDDLSREYVRTLVEELGGRYAEWNGPGRISHGDALNILIQDCDADVVVLVEDDAPVRTSGAVAAGLLQVQSGAWDVVSSPRESMSPELADAAREKWGECRSYDGSTGHGMWPAFVFARRDTLLATSRHYGERSWGRNQVVPGLGHTVRGEAAVVDTFGSTAFELRDAFQVLDVPQYKGPWGWERWLDRGHDIPWFHIGSLSSSGYLVLEVAGFAEGRTLTDEQELGEWSHRISWWERFLRTAGDFLPDRQTRYRRNLDRLGDRMGVEGWRIEAWDRIVDRMVTWEES